MNNELKELQDCFSCGGKSFITTQYIANKSSGNLINWDNYFIKTCETCGLGLIYPNISPQTLYKFYSVAYDENKFAFNNNYFNKTVYCPSMSQALNLGYFLDIYHNAEINFLDFGCGAFGYMFNSINQLYTNKKINYFGIDSSPLAISTLKFNKINHLGDDYHVLEKSELKFDAITMSHCLEHLEFNDALKCLNAIKNVLTKNGKLMIEVPCDDFRTEERKKNPSSPHTIFFTKESLVNILKKTGFEIYYCQVMGDDKNKYWDEVPDNPNNLKRLFHVFKSLIPISMKVKIKNYFNKNSIRKIFPNLFIINNNGFLLRVIVGKNLSDKN